MKGAVVVGGEKFVAVMRLHLVVGLELRSGRNRSDRLRRVAAFAEMIVVEVGDSHSFVLVLLAIAAVLEV